ncbi:uncharacterized protein [Montipora capricornis]|uniref:uncharacterized protein n=1 Tax=Montipora capricornis TaxID=246305 RepID=UPI0035F11FB8
MSSIMQRLKESMFNAKQTFEQSYDDTKENLDRMNSEWEELEKRTLTKIDETEEYFESSAGKEPEGAELEKIRSKGEQLSEEFEALYQGHTKMKASAEVTAEYVETRYRDSKQMNSQIASHGKNALIAAIVLGMIIGACVVWFSWKQEVLLTVLGALVGGGTVLVIGLIIYFSLTTVARGWEKKWKGLQESVTELKKMLKIIDTKAMALCSVQLEIEMMAKQVKSVTECKSELVENFKDYRAATTT